MYLLKQRQHGVVGSRAAARFGFQRPDILGGQVRRSVRPLLGLAALRLLIHRHLEDGERRDSSMARIVGIFIAPPKL